MTVLSKLRQLAIDLTASNESFTATKAASIVNQRDFAIDLFVGDRSCDSQDAVWVVIRIQLECFP